VGLKFAQPYAKRTQQQLDTLSKLLNPKIDEGGRKDFRKDDEVFRVWELAQQFPQQTTQPHAIRTFL